MPAPNETRGNVNASQIHCRNCLHPEPIDEAMLNCSQTRYLSSIKIVGLETFPLFAHPMAHLLEVEGAVTPQMVVSFPCRFREEFLQRLPKVRRRLECG